MYLNIDFDGLFFDLNLFLIKIKCGKCFFCVFSGEKDEFYSKGKVNVGLYFNRINLDGFIDMKIDGKIGVGLGFEGKRLEFYVMGFKGFVLFMSVSENLFGLLVEGEDLEIN